MAHPVLAFLPVRGLAPSTGFAKTIGPQMNGMAHEFVAGPADFGFADLNGFKADRSRCGNALEHLQATVASGIGADDPQQPGCQDLLCPGQASKQIVVGMVLKQSPNLLAVFVELLLPTAQQLAQAHRWLLALVTGDRMPELEVGNNLA